MCRDNIRDPPFHHDHSTFLPFWFCISAWNILPSMFSLPHLVLFNLFTLFQGDYLAFMIFLFLMCSSEVSASTNFALISGQSFKPPQKSFGYFPWMRVLFLWEQMLWNIMGSAKPRVLCWHFVLPRNELMLTLSIVRSSHLNLVRRVRLWGFWCIIL